MVVVEGMQGVQWPFLQWAVVAPLGTLLAEVHMVPVDRLVVAVAVDTLVELRHKSVVGVVSAGTLAVPVAPVVVAAIASGSC